MHQPQKHTILLINTALEQASVGISVDGILIDQIINTTQKEHAGFLHPAIESLCQKNGITLKELQAVSVINGPGSYTGLRVGLSAAKGICYANDLPLICINTLEWIAFGNREQATDLIAPMIDARRMEVFTAAYSKEMEIILAPTNLILDEMCFSSLLSSNRILFVGNGAAKWETICKHPHAHVEEGKQDETHHAVLANSYLMNQKFSSVFSASPFYTKDFYSTQKQ
jgi:tRNA threonylcarbamoyladenosine biosynthesis protein TsaB